MVFSSGGNGGNFGISVKDNTPPWLKVAWEEYEKYKGLKEMEEPLATRIKEYHPITNAKGSGYEAFWCLSFVNWCIKKSGYT